MRARLTVNFMYAHILDICLQKAHVLIVLPPVCCRLSVDAALQACLLLFKLWGGNISSRTPGDPANMFSYTGPAGIKVRTHACMVYDAYMAYWRT
jgi:hypothetical protein